MNSKMTDFKTEDDIGGGKTVSNIESAIFAAAYVDALRNIYEGKPMDERVKLSENEARYVVAAYRKYKINEVAASLDGLP